MSTEEETKKTRILQQVTVRFAVNPNGCRDVPGDLAAHLGELVKLRKFGVVDVQYDPDGKDAETVMEVSLPYVSGAAFGETIARHVELQEAERVALEAKYVGKDFAFYSPFVEHSGWFDGSTGTIVRLCRQYSEEAGDFEDLWIGMNQQTGQSFPLFGGEAFDRETLKPLIPEHRFLNWNPVKDIFKRDKNAEKGLAPWREKVERLVERADVDVRLEEQLADALEDEIEEQLFSNRKSYEARVARERGAGEIIAGQTPEELADALEKAAYGKRP